MDHTTADIASIAVPADDGDIRAALTHLEQRYAEYHSAVQQFHARLQQGPSGEMQSAGSAVVDSAAPKAKPAEAASASSVSTAPPKTSQPSSPAGSSGKPQGQAELHPGKSSDAARGPQPACKSDTSAAAAKTTASSLPAAPVQAAPGTSVPAAKPPAASAEQSDEALLASLDPETAQAIRVMRRLSPVKKSVREWLQEHEAERAAPAAPVEKKKSWFSRGR